jgi:hypothetical protein
VNRELAGVMRIGTYENHARARMNLGHRKARLEADAMALAYWSLSLHSCLMYISRGFDLSSCFDLSSRLDLSSNFVPVSQAALVLVPHGKRRQ